MNTIETVQALVARYETCAAETDAALRSARALLAQMQTEPIKAGSLDDALYSPDGSFGGAQSPTPVAPTFDEWWENHGKYNALFKFDHNASPSDRLARAKELMSLSWEVARESPAPVAVQPSQWQDIATAPKDGTLIDLAVVNVTSAKWNEMFEREPVDVSQYERIADAYWKDDNWCVRRTGGDGEDYDSEIADIGWWGSTTPTHWQPLPHLPLSASPEDKPK